MKNSHTCTACVIMTKTEEPVNDKQLPYTTGSTEITP